MSDDEDRIVVKEGNPFNGKEKEWPKWSRKVLARAEMKGYLPVLLGQVQVPPHTLVLGPDDEDHVQAILIRKFNIKAYDALMQACKDDISFGLVDIARTMDLPRGCARTAWENLCSRFEPTTAAAKIQVRKELVAMKLLSADEDPAPFVTKIERLKRRMIDMGVQVDDEEIMIHILANLPSEYNSTVEDLEIMMEANQLTLPIIIQRLNAQYLRIRKPEQNEEKVLSAVHRKPSKIVCRVCGKMGHKAADCWDNEKNKDKRPAGWKPKTSTAGVQDDTSNSRTSSGGRFAGTCFYCNKPGHRIEVCRKKKAADARNAAVAMNANAGPSDDHVLVATDTNIHDKNVWIADTGATSHMTNCDEGLFDIENISGKVTFGNGEKLCIVK
jgi:hypothetical protein